jgi:glutamate-1-semialdehyde 2,1-aminomutase
MNRNLSQKVYAASCKVIPGGVNSPVRSFPGLEMTPLIAARAQGDIVWDVDGNSYIDYCGSWGALISGHSHPSIVAAAVDQVQQGSSFGMATPWEQEIAEEIVKLIPSIEKIRFVSSGTEATMSAVRLARGFTGKPLFVKFNGNYHGHADGFLIRAGSGVTDLQESSSKGIPADLVKNTVSLPYNDTDAVRAFLRGRNDVAAVILEPVAGNMGVVIPSQEFLEMLREETSKIGALLIFDEVITGFRVGLRGAQGYFGITPDLTCLGKIIGAGFPAAAFGGSAEIMDYLAPLGPVYQAGTLSGNPVAMRAGLAALKEVQKPGFYEELERKTKIITEPVSELARVVSIGSMFTIFTDDYKSLFFHLFERGIYFPPLQYETCFVSMAHTDEHLKMTCDVLIEYYSRKDVVAKARAASPRL